MKIERLVIILFAALGSVGGIASNLFADLIFSVVVPLVGYVGMLLATLRYGWRKKKKWLIQNSLITFILMWLVVWILLYNLG